MQVRRIPEPATQVQEQAACIEERDELGEAAMGRSECCQLLASGGESRVLRLCLAVSQIHQKSEFLMGWESGITDRMEGGHGRNGPAQNTAVVSI